MKKFILTLFTLVLMATNPARADIVVLIHGYLGTPMSWESAGINRVLHENGWKRAGVVFENHQGVMLSKMAETVDNNPVYSVRLPSRAPLMVQSDMLHKFLIDLGKRHPSEKTVLVGHSAGGLVARLTLVRFGKANVSELITIASPHLGTHMAIHALEETHDSFPVGMIKDFFGGSTYHTVKSSTPLLVDLVPPRPGNLIFWLNNQPHPDIKYLSVVRGQDVRFNGDQVIPGFSQDMNNVPALRGKSTVYYVNTGHMLNPLDGNMLVRLLNENRRQAR
jgi:triacylglycerol lipase